MPFRIILRPATAGDLPRLSQIHAEIVRELSAFAPEGFGEPMKSPFSPEDARGLLAQELENQKSLLIVAEIENADEAREVAGFALGYVNEHPDDLFSAPFLTIVYIEVARAFRKQGIGRALLAEMEHLARARGIPAIDLQVWLANKPALRLFVQSSYQPLEMRMGKRVY